MRNFTISRRLMILVLTSALGLLVFWWAHSTPRVIAQGPPVCVTPPPDMVSWWPGDGNANDIIGPNHGALEGSVAFAPGRVGQAFRFNGNQNDGVNLGDVADFNFTPTSSFSIEAWVNLSAVAVAPDDGQFVVELNYKCGQNGDTVQTLAIHNTGRPFFFVRDANSVSASAFPPAPLATNTWYHLVGVREVTGAGKTVKLYVNGVLAASAPDLSTGPLANDGPDYIGRRFTCGTNNPFNGLIDEVSIYRRALSDAEIQAIYNADSAGKCRACTPPPSGMVSWLPGDGNANDIQGSNHGTLMNGATFAAGMVGQAFSFDGTSRVSAATTGLPIGNSNRTLDLWVKVNNFVAGEAFFAGYGSFGSFDQTYQLGTSGNILFFSQWGQAVVGPALQTGRWYHVAVTNVGTSVTLYLDGAAVASGNLSINTPSGTQLFVGSLPGDTFRRLDGLIDEVEIYNRALSASEIQAIVHADSAGKCKNRPPVATCQNVTVSAGASCTANASIDNGSSDPDGDPLTLMQSPPGPYPVGTTNVMLTVTDGKGGSSTCTATVTVVDNTPPTATSSVAQASLWPPNHDLINVGLAVTKTDNCTANPTVQVLVYSDEDDQEETGDGNHSPDAKDLAPGSLRLRSERKGDGDGRVYLIVVKVTDAAGNAGFACSTVVVPKSQSQANKDAVNAQAAAAKTYFQINGAPPSGYFVIGDGPIIGPKQ